MPGRDHRYLRYDSHGSSRHRPCRSPPIPMGFGARPRLWRTFGSLSRERPRTGVRSPLSAWNSTGRCIWRRLRSRVPPVSIHRGPTAAIRNPVRVRPCSCRSGSDGRYRRCHPHNWNGGTRDSGSRDLRIPSRRDPNDRSLAGTAFGTRNELNLSWSSESAMSGGTYVGS